jgi:ABC-type nitrate/sulfonate/bicarbonate transport system substrate-binding protein
LKNGINLTLIKYDFGAASLIKEKWTLRRSTSSLVRKPRMRVRAIGNIDKGEFIYLVARKDRIRNETDLKGMRVGTTAGTVAEFHLGRFLTLHGMTLQDVTLVDVKTLG